MKILLKLTIIFVKELHSKDLNLKHVQEWGKLEVLEQDHWHPIPPKNIQINKFLIT